MATIREETYRLMRSLGLTTVFGNPGSTEETFLENFPSDFNYILGLQEATVMAMADGYAQATGKPAFVNLHTAPGVGNSIGNLLGAWHNKTPLIVTAGQQTREMLLLEPWLTNIDATELPKPYVKWSYEPARAEDVPAALMRAFAAALQPPSGPVFLSIPMDDWDKESERETPTRQISTRVAPDPETLAEAASALSAAQNPVLIFGPGVDRSNGWEFAVTLAEKLRAPVYGTPAAERAGFPENHPQFQGALPFAIKPLGDKLAGHDVALVVGAPVFRYYPYVPGEYLPSGLRLIHITDDPGEAARAPVGDSILGDPALALASLTGMVSPSGRSLPEPMPKQPTPEAATPITPDYLFYALAQARPENAVLVQESPSNMKPLHSRLPSTHPASYFSMASGGLGFGLPASVGIALAERDTGRNRPVIAVIGDGSFLYSVQSLWTAAQHNLPLLVVVPQNTEYAILKSFAEFGETPGVPGLDLPGLDLVSIAQGFGCVAKRVDNPEEVTAAVKEALASGKPTVLVVPTTSEVPPLL
ncbi:MAG: benzoylformate decarboxylase [Janthinobacterium lividum]